MLFAKYVDVYAIICGIVIPPLHNPKNMKILITGISGMLGLDLWEEFSDDSDLELFGLDLHKPEFLPKENHIQCDISDFEDTYRKVTKINPDLIIHTAVMSDVDECEKNQSAAFKINALGTRNLAIAAQRFDSVILYISTDYVFGGSPPTIPLTRDGGRQNEYREYDETSPINAYGLSKLWGEFYVRDLCNKFYIIRTSWLFGKKKENFISTAAVGKGVMAAEDMVGSPTYTKDLSQAIKVLLSTPCSTDGRWGNSQLVATAFTTLQTAVTFQGMK